MIYHGKGTNIKEKPPASECLQIGEAITLISI